MCVPANSFASSAGPIPSAITARVRSFGPHGLGHQPDIIVALARAINNPFAGTIQEAFGVQYIGHWMLLGKANSQTLYGALPPNSAMAQRWCSPFRFESVYAGGGGGGATGGTESGGWWIDYDGASIHVTNWLANDLQVR
ncbi:hypothetical protein [Enterovirga sp. CN4-39]|uniref:hypothetical protein n=1 Tax=Enterovirga sp. CN4-39 TaxID=3400910 RepID=UPI003C0D768E